MSSWNLTTRSSQSDSVARWTSVTLYAALVTVGLMAGLFYAWDSRSCPASRATNPNGDTKLVVGLPRSFGVVVWVRSCFGQV